MAEKEPGRNPFPAAEYKDAVLGDTLETRMKKWEVQVRLAERFALFYVFSTDEKLNNVVELIKTKLRIDNADILHVTQDPTSGSSYRHLRENADRITQLQGDKLLMVVHGFEKVVEQNQVASPQTAWRVGHDNDQEYKEDKRSTDPVSLPAGKKVVVVTQIAPTGNRTIDDAAYQAAVQSQFKDDFFVIA